MLIHSGMGKEQIESLIGRSMQFALYDKDKLSFCRKSLLCTRFLGAIEAFSNQAGNPMKSRDDMQAIGIPWTLSLVNAMVIFVQRIGHSGVRRTLGNILW